MRSFDGTHVILGHIGRNALEELIEISDIPLTPGDSRYMIQCKQCLEDKMARFGAAHKSLSRHAGRDFQVGECWSYDAQEFGVAPPARPTSRTPAPPSAPRAAPSATSSRQASASVSPPPLHVIVEGHATGSLRVPPSKSHQILFLLQTLGRLMDDFPGPVPLAEISVDENGNDRLEVGHEALRLISQIRDPLCVIAVAGAR